MDREKARLAGLNNAFEKRVLQGSWQYDYRQAVTAMGCAQKPAAVRLDQIQEEKSERRVVPERRRFSYSAYIPERRSGRDRRVEAELEKLLAGLKVQKVE